MIVMPSNNCKNVVHYWQGKYGNLGLLIGPGGWRTPADHLPYALDNGAYPAFVNNKPWDQTAWVQLLCKARAHHTRPLWAVVPDVVGSAVATKGNWAYFSRFIRQNLPDVPLAFAVQDGMTKEDVPNDADVVFVGGSTDWKWETYGMWCGAFKRVHIGRVNAGWRLRQCADAGAESCDGTGWFRGDKRQLGELEEFLRQQSESAITQLKRCMDAADRALTGANRVLNGIGEILRNEREAHKQAVGK